MSRELKKSADLGEHSPFVLSDPKHKSLSVVPKGFGCCMDLISPCRYYPADPLSYSFDCIWDKKEGKGRGTVS